MDSLFGFDDRPSNVTADLGVAPAAVEQSATVLQVDRWGMRRANDIATRWEPEGLPSEITTIADAHESLFSPSPVPAEKPADERRAAWWKQLMETPEYRALHNQTVLDAPLSELAAANICREWAEYAEKHQPPESGGQEGKDGQGESIAETVARLRSTAKALKQAKDDVGMAQATAAGLGLGEGLTLPPQQMADYFKRVRDNRTLRAIMDMAGRMRSLCRALQRAKFIHGQDDTVGIELSGNLPRLVPSELLQLTCGIDELEMLALYRLANRQSLSREYRGIEKAGRGPIVMSVDESGSMSGEKIHAAKGMALALSWLAHHQKRWIMLAGFSGDETCARYIASPGQSRPSELLAWLEHMWNGGTVLDGPLSTVPSWWPEVRPPKGRVDHVIVTDAECGLPDSLRDSYRTWSRAEQVHTYGIVIGSREPGPLSGVCERCWALPNLDLDSVAVSEILSI